MPRNARPARKSATGLPGGSNLAGLGLLDIGSLNFDHDIDGGDDNDVDDGDLEAELNALMSGKRPKKREERKQKKAPLNLSSITAMADAVLKDDLSDHDSDLEGIDNDEALLAELNELNDGCSDTEEVPEKPPQPTPPSTQPATRPPDVPLETTGGSVTTSGPASPQDVTETLAERLKNYRDAEAAAKQLGDSSKARRFGRAIKSIESMLKQAQLGKAIPEDDIPPPVAIPKPRRDPPAVEEQARERPTDSDSLPQDSHQGQPPVVDQGGSTRTFPPPDIANALDGDIGDVNNVPPRPPTRPAPRPPQPEPSSQPTPGVQAQSAGQSQDALLTSRRDQYRQAALRAKQGGDNGLAMKYVRIAKQFDVVLQALREGKPVDLSKMPPPPPGMTSSSEAPPPIPPRQNAIDQIPEAFANPSSEPDPTLYKAPPVAHTVLEALEQRLTKYQETEAHAKEQGDSSRARRIGRIIKDYQAAIKSHKAGKKVNFDDLPAPPGFGPIPTEGSAGPPPAPTAKPATPQTDAQMGAAAAKAPAKTSARPEASPSAAPSPPKQSVRRQLSTTMEKQKQFLLQRQQLFKEAAKDALKNGASKEQAMEYLRMMKGIEPMLEATESGLPVDFSSIPVPPQLQQDFVVVEKDDCNIELSGDSEELYRTLEKELEQQHKMCMTNKEHFFKLGDVGSGTKFEKLGQDTQRDLSVLKSYWKRGDPPPRFHYEERVFTIVRHNHDVAENSMQICVVRGISLPGKPNELDTYLKIEFAYPSDAPQSYKGSTVRDTTNPEYNTTCSFEVSRKSRTFLRALKRVQLKIEVWSKRGFLRADGLLGVASIKLQDLETKCEIHEVFSVMDGRRDTGGKLEVKVRVTEPFAAKQVEEIKERWLLITS